LLAQVLQVVHLLNRRFVHADHMLHLLSGLALALHEAIQLSGVLLLGLRHLLVHLGGLVRLVDHLADYLLALRSQTADILVHAFRFPSFFLSV
jgi:hypothetical protein